MDLEKRLEDLNERQRTVNLKLAGYVFATTQVFALYHINVQLTQEIYLVERELERTTMISIEDPKVEDIGR